MLTFSQIQGTWANKCVYIIGGGPSLRGFDFSKLKGLGPVIGVNKGAFRVPCDTLFSLDQTFARSHRSDIVQFIEDGGEAILAMPPNEAGHKQIPGATYVNRRRNNGLSDDPRDIYGTNSGYGALGVAYQRTPRAVGLLGFDMNYDAELNTHWHEGYPWHSRQNKAYMFRWANAFDRAAYQCEERGISVTNFVGPAGSMVKAFPTGSYDDL